MIKIPNNKKWSITNNSDLFGDLYYTKSVYFDEQGYLKLSNRAVSLINRRDYEYFGYPVSFGRFSTSNFKVATTIRPYNLDISDSGVSSINIDLGADTTAPDGNSITYGKWWRNFWHQTNNTKMWYRDTSWVDTGITLTTGVSHPIEAFEKSNTLMVGNGNTVKQLNSSYAVGSYAQLTISTDFEIIGLAYNNNFLGIATRLSSTTTGKNLEAEFFTWDGSASSANAGYKVGSDTILAIAPYKSSFVILNRLGKLLYFNGGGFTELASFPNYFKDVIWGDGLNKISFGDSLIVEGDFIYININNQILDNKLNSYLDNFLGGVWCYDPAVGLYQRYSPSFTVAQVLDVIYFDTNESKLTLNTDQSYPTNTTTIPSTGNPLKVLDTTFQEIKEGNIYYIIKLSSTQFQLAETYADAIVGTYIDLTTTGTIVNKFLALDLKDYGHSKTFQSSGLGMFGYKTNFYDKIIFGANIQDPLSTSNYNNLNITVSGFKNIGYSVTSKINSSLIEDNIQKLFLKYRPLKTDDKIKIKYQNKDINNLPQYASCTASSNTVITTTNDISDAYNAYNANIELECEIVGGSGAGQMTKILSITESSGTYTITLNESMDGLVATDKLYIKLENWNELITITNADSENWKEVSVARNSKWTKFKVVLEGSETTIEELLIDNIKHI